MPALAEQFVGTPNLSSRQWQLVPCSSLRCQQADQLARRIVPERLDEHGVPARLEHSADFANRGVELEVMQYGSPDHHIQRFIRKRQAMAVHDAEVGDATVFQLCFGDSVLGYIDAKDSPRCARRKSRN